MCVYIHVHVLIHRDIHVGVKGQLVEISPLLDQGTELRLSGLEASDYPLTSPKQLTLCNLTGIHSGSLCSEDQLLWWSIRASSHQSFPMNVELGLYQHLFGSSLETLVKFRGYESYLLLIQTILSTSFIHYFTIYVWFFQKLSPYALTAPQPLYICFINCLLLLFIFSFKALLSGESCFSFSSF